ncbi:MAG: hypothetical protein OEZ59_09790 [Deltaproteobacteria bacterium]|nr:hypothetical protein [Deltaproteobacteria bacterium]
MAPNPLQEDQDNQPHSPYTVAMARCLQKLEGLAEGAADEAAVEKVVVHTLINLVQGRMLEYLADRICREYDISDPASRQSIVGELLQIFSDEFFALFRTKVEQKPNMVIKLARRITRTELRGGESGSDSSLPTDRLFPAIFRKYFEYSNLALLLQMVESDTEIQKIILLHMLKRRLDDARLIGQITEVLDGDAEGIASNLFLGYLQSDDPHLLVDKINSGNWKEDMRAMKSRMALLRGD